MMRPHGRLCPAGLTGRATEELCKPTLDGRKLVKRWTGVTGLIAMAGLILVGLTSGCLSMMVSEDAPIATSVAPTTPVEAGSVATSRVTADVLTTPGPSETDDVLSDVSAVATPTRETPVVAGSGAVVPADTTPRVTPEQVAGVRGTIYSLPADSAYDDLVVLHDQDDLQVGIMSFDPELEMQLQSLRDSGQVLLFWGLFYHDAEDFGGGRLVVERFAIEGATFTPTVSATPTDEAGTSTATPTGTLATGTPTAARSRTPTPMPSASPTATARPSITPTRSATPSPTRTATRAPSATATPSPTLTATATPTATATRTVAVPTATHTATSVPASRTVDGWLGTIQGAEPDSPYDDFFESSDGGEDDGRYGLTTSYSRIARQIAYVRDTGHTVRIWGVLDYGVDDYNDCQIIVVRIEWAVP